jgi:NitT/TauT family transport system substrate-binding protein
MALTALSRRSLVIGTAAAAATAAARPASAQTSLRLTVCGPANDGFKACIYGVRSGLFTKSGLNVDATFVASGAAAAAALIGGSADVAYTNVVSAISARAKNIPVQIIAPGPIINQQTSLAAALVVLKDGPIRTAADLSGKNVGAIALGDLAAVGTQAWIDKNGGDSRAIKFIEIPQSTAVQMLEEGRVSAAGLNEPMISQAVASGKVRVLASTLTAIAPTFLASFYIVMAPVAESKAEAMRRFAAGMHEAGAYTNTHQAETVELVANYTATSPDAVAKSIRVADAEYAEAPLLQPVIDAMTRYGLLQSSFPAATLISPYAARRR